MSANFTHPYWNAPTFTRQQKFLKPISGSLGFQFNLPWRDPVTAGWYYGEGAPYGRRTVVTDSRPEFYTVGGNIMPSVNGIPRMDPHSSEMTFSRAKYTKNIPSV